MATKLADLTVASDGTWSSGPHTLPAGAATVTLRRVSDGATLVTRTFTVTDSTAPSIGTLTVPDAASTSITGISIGTTTDTVGITGWMIVDQAADTGWSAPSAATIAAAHTIASTTSWTASDLTHTAGAVGNPRYFRLYVRDAAGNVTGSATDSAVIGDYTAPSVGTLTVPDTSGTSITGISIGTTTDSVGVTKWMIKEAATDSFSAPVTGDSGWTSISSTTSWSSSALTFTSTATETGTRYFRLYACDAAGNVGASATDSATITIAASDTTAPSVGTLTVPDTTGTAISGITASATDAVGVTAWMIVEQAADSGWSAPSASAIAAANTISSTTSFSSSSISFTSSATETGTRYFRIYFRDAAGNVEGSATDSATITIAAEKFGDAFTGSSLGGTRWPTGSRTTGGGGSISVTGDSLFLNSSNDSATQIISQSISFGTSGAVTLTGANVGSGSYFDAEFEERTYVITTASAALSASGAVKVEMDSDGAWRVFDGATNRYSTSGASFPCTVVMTVDDTANTVTVSVGGASSGSLTMNASIGTSSTVTLRSVCAVDSGAESADTGSFAVGGISVT